MQSKKNQQAINNFDLETFETIIKGALKKSEENFILLVDAYRWAQDHEKEINRRWKGFSRGWLQERFKMIFGGKDPAHYSLIIRRLAGRSMAVQKVKAAWKFAMRVGSYELYRADQVLTAQQMGILMEKFPAGEGLISSVEVREVVDEMARILKDSKHGRTTTNGKRSRGELEREIAALTKEVQLLLEELQGYKRLIARSKLVKAR